MESHGKSFTLPELSRGFGMELQNRVAILTAIEKCGGVLRRQDLERSGAWDNPTVRKHLRALTDARNGGPLRVKKDGKEITCYQIESRQLCQAYIDRINRDGKYGLADREIRRRDVPEEEAPTESIKPTPSDLPTTSFMEIPEFKELADRVRALEERIQKSADTPKAAAPEPGTNNHSDTEFVSDEDFGEGFEFGIAKSDNETEEAIVIVDGRNIENHNWYFTLDDKERFVVSRVGGDEVLMPTLNSSEYGATPYYRLLSEETDGKYVDLRMQGPRGPISLRCTRFNPLAFDRIPWERLVQVCKTLGGKKYSISRFHYLTNFVNRDGFLAAQEASIQRAAKAGVQVIADNAPGSDKIGDVDGHVTGDICNLPDMWLIQKKQKSLPIPKSLHLIVFSGDGVIAREIANKKYVFRELHGIKLVVHVISWESQLCQRARAGHRIHGVAKSVHNIESFSHLLADVRKNR